MDVNDRNIIQLVDGRIGRVFDISNAVNGLYAVAIKDDKQNIIHMIKVSDIARVIPEEELPKIPWRETTDIFDILVNNNVTFKGELIEPRDKYVIMKTVEAILKSKKL